MSEGDDEEVGITRRRFTRLLGATGGGAIAGMAPRWATDITLAALHAAIDDTRASDTLRGQAIESLGNQVLGLEGEQYERAADVLLGLLRNPKLRGPPPFDRDDPAGANAPPLGKSQPNGSAGRVPLRHARLPPGAGGRR